VEFSRKDERRARYNKRKQRKKVGELRTKSKKRTSGVQESDMFNLFRGDAYSYFNVDNDGGK